RYVRVEQVGVPGQRADAELAAEFFDVGEFGQAVDVDQYAGLGQPQLHHRDEAVAAGQHAVVRPAQQRQRVLDAAGALVLDVRRDLHIQQIKPSLISVVRASVCPAAAGRAGGLAAADVFAPDLGVAGL